MRSVADAQIPTGTLGRFVSGLTVDVVRVEPGSAMDGTRLADSRLREETGASVVGLQRANGDRLANPAGPDVLQPDDIVLLIGRSDQLIEAVRRFAVANAEEPLTPEAARLSQQMRARS
jgi:K+/H+ antiporter YhaU regulatory subunit KhtT